MTPEKLREYRKKLKEKGICVRCHKNATNGSVICRDCQDASNEKRRQYRKDRMRCRSCLAKIDEYSASIGSTRCMTCTQNDIESHRRSAMLKGW